MQSEKMVKISRSSTFKVTLGVFCSLGFLQLMAVGVAYTTRAGKEVVKYERAAPVVLVKPVQEKEIIPNNPVRSLEAILADQKMALPKIDPNASWGAGESLPKFGSKNGSQEYVIRDPLVGRLLKEAKELEKMGDMGGMILKLEEAKALDPMEPAVLYMDANLHEDMDRPEKARELYLKIIKIGYTAGIYRKKAWKRMEDLSKTKVFEGVLALGKLNISRAKDLLSAKVTIPISKTKEDVDIVRDLVEVRVHFYDRTKKGEVVKAGDNAIITPKWQNKQVDWSNRKEEVLSVDYSLAVMDDVQRVLFGDRVYYGQVVELYYKGKIQDVVAYPSILHKIHADNNLSSQRIDDPLGMPDINFDNPLLPPLEIEQ